MSMEPCTSTVEESTIVGSSDSADLNQSAIFDTCTFDQNGWEDFHLKVVHGVDKKFRVTIESKYFSIRSDVYAVAGRRISVADYLLRKFRATIEMAVSSDTYVRILSPSIDQYILKRSCINISTNNGNVCIDFNLLIDNPDEEFQHLKKLLSPLILQWISCSNIDAPEARAHWQNSEDQNALRKMVSIVGVSFVADGSILPRAGGNHCQALSGGSIVPFVTPSSLRAEFNLPHSGKITGMLIPKGVTVITGGGYHGKSTILNAIKAGIYNKVPGDGREFVVTNSSAVAVRSEDGRYVSGVDISPFIDNLPEAANMDPRSFSTNSASGSTSMAANIVESIELKSEVFLLDEDTCASNFMIRDSRMRSMIPNEPITPFIYRVNSLHKEKGISTVVVIGGCGDWFDVQDTTIIMDNYRCEDATKKARSICKTFCTGRVQYNGRGLVHQLPWPGHESSNDVRTLKTVQLPVGFMNSGTVTAAEDGHSVTFCPKVFPHYESNARFRREFKHRKERPLDSDDDKNFCRNMADKASLERGTTVDLSRIEQMVPSKEGALGIALAILFVHSIMELQAASRIIDPTVSPHTDIGATDGLTSEKNSEGGRSKRKFSTAPTHEVDPDSCFTSPVPFNSDNHLHSLLVRFDNLRDQWECETFLDSLRSEEDTSSGSLTASPQLRQQTDLEICAVQGSNNVREAEISNFKQAQRRSDMTMAKYIHERLMNDQDFAWPRLNEAAASMNRFRLTSFL